MSEGLLLHDQQSGRAFSNVAVFRALQLGDLLCAEPAFRALRAALPEARITLVGLPWAREFAAIYASLIDDFIAFPGFPGMAEQSVQPQAVAMFLREVQARRFDLVVQMHGNGSLSNPVVALFGSEAMAGFFVPGAYCPDERRFLPYPNGTHEIWRHLQLMSHLGAPSVTETPQYPISALDHAALSALSLGDLPRGEYVCVHPGARAGFRCWPTAKFAQVADRLAEAGFRVVITGTSGEQALAEDVASQMKHNAIIAAGKTSLRALAALIDGARLLICNDTGVSHLAVALKVSSVVVFTRSEFQGWPPLDRVRHRVVARLQGVECDQVVAEALELIEKGGATCAG